MFVAVAKFEINLSFCQTLKDKRQIINKIKGRVAEKFKIPVSEVGFQDKWQRGELGFSFVGGDHSHLESLMDQMMGFIESLGVAEVIEVQKEIVSF